jgi:hypothetical protein
MYRNMIQYHRAVIAGLLLLIFVPVGLFLKVIEAAAAGPMLIWQGKLANKFELLLDAQEKPHVLWKNSTDAQPFDEKVHLAGISSKGWEVLSTSIVSGEEPIGAYDQHGTLYLVIRNIRPLNTLSILALNASSIVPQVVAEFRWPDFIFPIFLSPPEGDQPLHLIFDSAEWRWTPFLGFFSSGHYNTAYAKYFFILWDGQQWSKPVQLIERGKFDARDLACAMSELHHIACVWTDGRYGWEDIALFFAEYDGKQWSKSVELGGERRASLHMNPTIAMAKDGQVTVAFIPTDVKGPKGDQFESQGLLVQQRQGQTWGKVQQLSVPSSRAAFSHSSSAEEPRLSIDSKNRVHLIWQEGPRIMHRMQLSEQWTPPTVLVDTEGKIRYLTPLRFSPDGQAHLAWSEWAGAESQIWYQAFQFE